MVRYAVAVWNYMEAEKPLIDLVAEFAGMGFTALAFTPRILTPLTPHECQELYAFLMAKDLIVTLHSNAAMPVESWSIAVEILGDRLRTITLDAPRIVDSIGRIYDASTARTALERIRDLTASTEVRFGYEDFPWDSRALEFYRDAFSPFLDDPRFGMLIDLGHLNIRLHKEESAFKGLTPQEHLRSIPFPVLEIHIHDNMGEKDSHLPPGQGNTDFEGIAKGLRELGFDGVSTIEIAPQFHESTPAQSKPFVKPSLEFWRGLM